jgi:hypothetical protein
MPTKDRIRNRHPRSCHKGFAAILLLAFSTVVAFNNMSTVSASEAAAKALRERTPIKITELHGLSFGQAMLSGKTGGTVTISPTSGTIATSGTVTKTTGMWQAAEFEVRGQPEEYFAIVLPSTLPLRSRNLSGTPPTLTNIVSEPAGTGRFGADGKARIKVGGTLNFPQSTGNRDLRAELEIQVDYENSLATPKP